jgi:hypothetical protein
MATFILITAAAVAIVTGLAVMLLMVTVAIKREDRRVRGLRAPAPGRVALIARRVTGLHAHQPQPLTRPPQRADPGSGRSPGRR